MRLRAETMLAARNYTIGERQDFLHTLQATTMIGKRLPQTT